MSLWRGRTTASRMAAKQAWGMRTLTTNSAFYEDTSWPMATGWAVTLTRGAQQRLNADDSIHTGAAHRPCALQSSVWAVLSGCRPSGQQYSSWQAEAEISQHTSLPVHGTELFPVYSCAFWRQTLPLPAAPRASKAVRHPGSTTQSSAGTKNFR